MEIDFLRDGSDDCPLIRLKKGVYEDYDKLISAIKNLIDRNEKFDMLKLKGFIHDSTIETLVFDMQDEEKDIIESTEGCFYCSFCKQHLHDMIEMLRNYQGSGTAGSYHWLHDSLGIQILLSVSGQW